MAGRKLKGLSLPAEGQPVRNYKKLETPGHSSAESVAATLKTNIKKIVKTMIYQNAKNELFAVLVRGDHEVSEFKLKKAEPGAFLAHRDTIDRISAFGFTGPLGLKDMKLYVDEDLVEMKAFVVGANERDQHYVGMNWEDILFLSRDERSRGVVVGDFRQVVEGDLSADGQPLQFRTAIELGHIFKLNLRYSEPLGARYLDEHGKEQPILMGCYGIGVNRILAAAIEQHADEKGIVWPRAISPYEVQVILIDPKDAQSRELADALEKGLEARGIDVLVDDRADTAGVKFNDADLIGIPLRVILGPKNLVNGKAEIKIRKTGQALLVDVGVLLESTVKQLDSLA